MECTKHKEQRIGMSCSITPPGIFRGLQAFFMHCKKKDELFHRGIFF